MRRRVGIDETLLPVRRRAVSVVRRKRVLVGLAFISEHLAEAGRVVPHQPLPIVVPRLVTEVPEERPIGLVHRHPHALAQVWIRFQQVDRDEAFEVPGDDRFVGCLVQVDAVEACVGQYMECEAVLALVSALHREPQGEQREQQAPLRLLDLVVELDPPAVRQVRDDLVQGARPAECVVRRRHQPVAGSESGAVGAVLVPGSDGTQCQVLDIERQLSATSDAAVVLEVDAVAAGAAK